jgi:hypothetical protein
MERTPRWIARAFMLRRVCSPPCACAGDVNILMVGDPSTAKSQVREVDRKRSIAAPATAGMLSINFVTLSLRCRTAARAAAALRAQHRAAGGQHDRPRLLRRWSYRGGDDGPRHGRAAPGGCVKDCGRAWVVARSDAESAIALLRIFCRLLWCALSRLLLAARHHRSRRDGAGGPRRRVHRRVRQDVRR